MCSIVNMDKKKKSREFSEEESKKIITKHCKDQDYKTISIEVRIPKAQLLISKSLKSTGP